MIPGSPSVSVIMPVFNSERYLAAALDSVLRQSLSDLEVLVVDDASTDRSWGVLRSYDDARIRRWRFESNAGPAAARNHALDQARGRYIAFLDSDDIANPDWLRHGVTFLETHPGYDIVGGRTETIDERGLPIPAAGVSLCPPERLAVDMLFVNRLSTSTLLMDRAIIGPERFDPTLAVASDYEMWTRLLEAGTPYVLKQVLAQYRVHSAGVTARQQASAEPCMREIMRRQLRRLDIEPSEEELALHLQIPHLTVCTPKDTVMAAERWLMKLARANERAGVYPLPAFRDLLVDRWYGVCFSACEHELWTWRRFNASPICRLAPVGSRRRLRLWYLTCRARCRHAISQLNKGQA